VILGSGKEMKVKCPKWNKHEGGGRMVGKGNVVKRGIKG